MELEILAGNIEIEEEKEKFKNVVFTSFEDMNASKVVHQFLFGGDRNDISRIVAKNEILMELIRREQSIDLDIKVKNKCVSCNGLGFNPNIFTIKSVKCPTCMGTGWLVKECKRCMGTGKLGETPCYTCRGQGIYIYKKTARYHGVKCFSCLGSGVKVMLVQKDEEPKLCPVCNGLGISKIATNPVLDPAIGNTILSLIVKKE